jgi:hypothetical protein
VIEGFYNIAFTGAKGSGFGNLVISRGTVVGADAAGSTYDGTYTHDPKTKTIKLNVTMSAPAGVSPVQTGVPLTAAMSLPIETSIPEDFGSGKTILVNTPIGPVNVVFRKLRELPA